MQIEHYTKATQGGKCTEWLGIVRRVAVSPDQKQKTITFGFRNFPKPGSPVHERVYVAKAGEEAYKHAEPNRLFLVELAANGEICGTPRSHYKCINNRQPHSVCEFGRYPHPDDCSQRVTAVVLSSRATPAGRAVEFKYQFELGYRNDVYNAPAAFSAKPGDLFTLSVNAFGMICQNKPVTKAGDCKTRPKEKVCQGATAGPAPGGECLRTEDIDGLVVENLKTGSGKCSLSFRYLDKANNALLAVHDGTGADCDVRPGQGYRALRSASSGRWCGVKRPLRRLDTMCVKPYTPANAELCKFAPSDAPAAPGTPQPQPQPVITDSRNIDARTIDTRTIDTRTIGDGNRWNSPTNNYYGGGGAGAGINLSLNIENQNKSQSEANAQGGPRGGWGYAYPLGVGPHLYPGGVYGPSFILPPEKYVVPVPGDTYVIGDPLAQATDAPVIDTQAPTDTPVDEEPEEPVYTVPPVLQSPATPAPKKPSRVVWYVASALIILALAALGFYLWKKKKGRASSGASPLFL